MQAAPPVFIRGGRCLPPAPLAGIDFNSGYMPVRRVFFYAGTPDIERLQRSLAAALAQWPDFSATIAEHDGRLSLLRNDTGVRFTVVQSDEAAPAFGIDHPLGLPCPWVDEAIGQRAGDGAPVCTVQVTLYADQHWVLGTCNSHALCDGSGYWQFMQGWCDAFHGRPLPDPGTDFPRFTTPEPQTGMPAAFREPADKLLPRQMANLATYRTTQSLVPHAQLEAAKQAINAELAPAWVSSADALMAQLWQALARAALATGLPPDTLFQLGNVINVRPRLGLQHYTGNMAFNVVSQRTLAELAQTPQAALAQCLRSDSQQLPLVDVHAFLHYLQQKLEAGQVNSAGYFTGFSSVIAAACVDGCGLMVNNWSKFPAYDMDFSGAPLWFDLATVVPMQFVMLMPHPDGIVVRWFLDAERTRKMGSE